MALGFFALGGCAKKPSKYTEAEHIQRITERIEKRFMTSESEYTGFSVYPLYNEKDELKYFLVEFEPVGFVYVMLRDERSALFSCFGGRTSMYGLSDIGGDSSPWQRYTIDETNNQPAPDKDICYEVDENGDFIYYMRSPYATAGIKEEQRYLLNLRFGGSSFFITAVKRNGNYINLISMGTMDIVDGQMTKKQAIACISFIAKKEFDL